MNERIEKLILKAGFHPFVRGEQILFDISTEENLKEFSDLLLQECINVLQKRFMGDLNREDIEVRRCIEDIKTHFGV